MNASKILCSVLNIQGRVNYLKRNKNTAEKLNAKLYVDKYVAQAQRTTLAYLWGSYRLFRLLNALTIRPKKLKNGLGF
jgi:hypothetical protein